MNFKQINPRTSIPLSSIPTLSISDFTTELKEAIDKGATLSALWAQSSSEFGVRSSELVATPSSEFGARSSELSDNTNQISSSVNDGQKNNSELRTPNSELLLLALLQDHSKQNTFYIAQTPISDTYPSLTPTIPQAHYFEREIHENTGIIPQGHPWLKAVRQPLGSSKLGVRSSELVATPSSEFGARSSELSDNTDQISTSVNDGQKNNSELRTPNSELNKSNSELMDSSSFYTVEGTAIHEVAVGPVHAGVIEPGHFRFQCSGERVHHLEIALGYQHRGIERRLPTAGTKAIHYIETLSGDSTIAHATAWCRLGETLTETTPSPRAEAIRALALELERIANHVGDLGALAGDVAFLPTASYCGRIRGEYLNMTAEICGNRFGRNLIRQGGVAYDLSQEQITKLTDWLNRVWRDTQNALDLMFDAPTVLDRFENTGTVSREDAIAIGMVGMAARASAIPHDQRIDAPRGWYASSEFGIRSLEGGFCSSLTDVEIVAHSDNSELRTPNSELGVATSSELRTPNSELTGDVLSRAQIRYQEIKSSIKIIQHILANLPAGETITAPTHAPAPNALAFSIEEGWRGEIVHIVTTDSQGEIANAKIIDPSFRNWFGLALALREQEISDFPICNKSFNLSYCGHDL